MTEYEYDCFMPNCRNKVKSKFGEICSECRKDIEVE